MVWINSSNVVLQFIQTQNVGNSTITQYKCWDWAVDVVDSKMDWSNAHTDIEVTMQYVLEMDKAGYIDKEEG